MKKIIFFIFVIIIILSIFNFASDDELANPILGDDELHGNNFGDEELGEGTVLFCEEITPTPTPGPGGTGGGGGGTGCTYDWDCTNWFPPECPESGIQERLCVNRGTCSGKSKMPSETMTCTFEGAKEPLFDIFLTLDSKTKKFCPGQDIKTNVRLENYGKIELLDAFMTYWIVDENNKLIYELKDTRAISDKKQFDVLLNTPRDTINGTYKVYAQINYGVNKTALAGESFEIVQQCESEYNKIYFNLSLIIGNLIIIILIIIIAYLIIRRRKRNKINEENKKILEKKKITKKKKSTKKKVKRRYKKA